MQVQGHLSEDGETLTLDAGLPADRLPKVGEKIFVDGRRYIIEEVVEKPPASRVGLAPPQRFTTVEPVSLDEVCAGKGVTELEPGRSDRGGRDGGAAQ